MAHESVIYSPSATLIVGTVTLSLPVSLARSVRMRSNDRLADSAFTPRMLRSAYTRCSCCSATHARSTLVFQTCGEKPVPASPAWTSSYSVISDMVRVRYGALEMMRRVRSHHGAETPSYTPASYEDAMPRTATG